MERLNKCRTVIWLCTYNADTNTVLQNMTLGCPIELTPPLLGSNKM